MTRFKFRLDRVRRLRLSEERAALAAVASRLQELGRAEEALKNHEEREAVLLGEMEKLQRETPMRMAALVALHQDLDTWQSVRLNLRNRCVRHQQELDQARAEWAIRHTARRALDELEARDREEHRSEESRREGIRLDEVASTRHRGNL